MCAFSVQNLEKVHVAAFVAGPRQPSRHGASLGSIGDVREAVPGTGMGYEGVFGFFQGFKHGLLVGGEGDIVAGVGLSDLRLHPSQVEGRPGNARSYDVTT